MSDQVSDKAKLLLAHAIIIKLCKEFRAHDLPYGSEAYQQANAFLNGNLPVFKHKQSGGCYVKLLDVIHVKSKEPLPLTIYVGDTGDWARDKAQFDDGRFERIS